MRLRATFFSFATYNNYKKTLKDMEDYKFYTSQIAKMKNDLGNENDWVGFLTEIEKTFGFEGVSSIVSAAFLAPVSRLEVKHVINQVEKIVRKNFFGF